MADKEVKRRQRILFLDIDGVLNHAAPGQDLYHDKFENEKVPICKDNLLAFKNLLEACPDVKIVWSTSWRDCEDEEWQSWRNPRLWLEEQDFMKDKVIGITPRHVSCEHFQEIYQWLKANIDAVEAYVILEDDYFPSKWFGLEKHVVKVDNSKGLTGEDI